MGLADRSCGTCTAATPRSTEAEIAAYLTELLAWSVHASRLKRVVALPDFATALSLANRIGAIAEAEGHHPDLLVAWGRLEVSLFTHAIGGLSTADFVLAAKIDRLLV